MEADGVSKNFCHSKLNCQGSPQFLLAPTLFCKRIPIRAVSTEHQGLSRSKQLSILLHGCFPLILRTPTRERRHHLANKAKFFSVRTKQHKGSSNVWCKQNASASGRNRDTREQKRRPNRRFSVIDALLMLFCELATFSANATSFFYDPKKQQIFFCFRLNKK